MQKQMLVALLVVACAPLLLAKRGAGGGETTRLQEGGRAHKEGGRNKEVRAPACRYRSVFNPATPCDPETGLKNITQELIVPPHHVGAPQHVGAPAAAAEPSPCPPTNTIQKRCRVPGGVRGSREVKAGGKKQGGGGEGGRGKNRKGGQLTTLAPVEEPEGEQVMQVVPEVAGGAGGKNPACKYKKSGKGECDPTTNKKTVTLELKRGKKTQAANCPPTKTIVKDCRVKPVRPSRKGPKFF